MNLKEILQSYFSYFKEKRYINMYYYYIIEYNWNHLSFISGVNEEFILYLRRLVCRLSRDRRLFYIVLNYALEFTN